MSQVVASFVSLAGIFVAYFFYLLLPGWIESLSRNPVAERLGRFWFSGWGFDRAYDALFVRPFLWLADLNKQDAIDSIYAGIARVNVAFHVGLGACQTGGLRWYALGMAAGAVLFLGIVILIGMN